MSATGWTRCPNCQGINPDADPDSDYYGTVRMDHEWSFKKYSFSFRFWCVDCGWRMELTEKNTKDLQIPGD